MLCPSLQLDRCPSHHPHALCSPLHANVYAGVMPAGQIVGGGDDTAVERKASFSVSFVFCVSSFSVECSPRGQPVGPPVGQHTRQCNPLLSPLPYSPYSLYSPYPLPHTGPCIWQLLQCTRQRAGQRHACSRHPGPLRAVRGPGVLH